MFKSLAAKVLLALVIGLAVGIAVSSTANPALTRVSGVIEPVGTLWINALRMTVLPLVVGAIIVGVGSTSDLKLVGSIGSRAIALFFLLLFAAAFVSTFVAYPLLSHLRVNPDGVAALGANAAQASASAVEGAQKIQSFSQWLIDLIPTNPVKAAADGAMLPLVVFSVAFGLALTRISSPGRETMLAVAGAVADVALTLVRWILWLAPIGVFALSVAVARRLGISAAGAVVFYMAVVCGLCALFIAVLYAAVWAFARRPVRIFPRLWAPAQAVAFSSRSSLVALPAMIEAARILRQPEVIRSFLLPLAVATFRIGATINIPVGVLFLARLYGADLGTAQLLTIALTSVVTSLGVPGIPGGTIIVMVPVLLAANLPVEGVGILLAVDTLPDMFRTATNATGDLAVAAIISRDHPGNEGDEPWRSVTK